MGRGCCCTTPAVCKKSGGCSPWFFNNYGFTSTIFKINAAFTKNQVTILQVPKLNFGYEIDIQKYINSSQGFPPPDAFRGYHDLCSDSELTELYFIPYYFRNISSPIQSIQLCEFVNGPFGGGVGGSYYFNQYIKILGNVSFCGSDSYFFNMYNNFYIYQINSLIFNFYPSYYNYISKVFKLKKGTYNVKLSNMQLISMANGDLCAGGKIRCSNTGNTVNGYYFQGDYGSYARIISGTQTKPVISNVPGRISSYCNISYPKASPYYAYYFYQNTGSESLNPNGEYILDVSEDTHVVFNLNPLYKYKIEQKFKDSNIGKLLTYFKLYNTPNDKTESIFNISGDGIECMDDIAVLNANFYNNSSTICGNYFEGQ